MPLSTVLLMNKLCKLLVFSIVVRVQMQAAGFCKSTVPIYLTTQHHNPEDHNINVHRLENLNSYTEIALHQWYTHWNSNGKLRDFPFLTTVSTDKPPTNRHLCSYILALDGDFDIVMSLNIHAVILKSSGRRSNRISSTLL
jgi:hypothetical protein